MEDSRLTRSMLLDFYGELLTEKQREYFDLHYNEDLSLAEIAEMSGVSRQAVWDMIRRAEATMLAIEEKTGLMRRYNEQSTAVAMMKDKLKRLGEITQGEAKAISEALAEMLDSLI